MSITSLPFVHTARRYYRLNVLVRSLDCLVGGLNLLAGWEDDQTVAFRGSKSRNKVSVGEPAEGSLSVARLHRLAHPVNPLGTRIYRSVLGALTCLSKLATSLSVWSDLLSAAGGGQDGPRLSRYRTPFAAVVRRVVGCLKRFKEPPPRPGFVISPCREVQPTFAFARPL